MLALLLIPLAVVIGYFVRKELIKRYENYDVPEPEVKRTDLKYGSYGSFRDTDKQAHFNLFWAVPHWEGLDVAVEKIKSANKTTVLDLQECLFEQSPETKKFSPYPIHIQEEKLTNLFNRLRVEKVLHLVKVLYPVDEPNLPETAVDDHMPSAIAVTRTVAAKFKELRDVKIGVSFYYDRPMQHIRLYDIVGFNMYPAKSGILRPGGKYDQMVKQLSSDQQTWLFPGGTYGQSPKPFMNFAHSHPEVYAVIPFIWGLPEWHKDFLGIMDIPEMRKEYEEVKV